MDYIYSLNDTICPHLPEVNWTQVPVASFEFDEDVWDPLPVTTGLLVAAVTFWNESLKIVKVFPACTVIFGNAAGSVTLSSKRIGNEKMKLKKLLPSNWFNKVASCYFEKFAYFHYAEPKQSAAPDR